MVLRPTYTSTTIDGRRCPCRPIISPPKVTKLWLCMLLRPFGVELLSGNLIVAAIFYFPTVRFEVHRRDSLLLIDEYDCAIQIDFLSSRGGIVSHKPLGRTGLINRRARIGVGE